MRAQEVIAQKRDGQVLTAEAIESFIAGYVRGEVADYQAAAFCMAVYLRGMNTEETAALTRAMAHSGEMLDLAAGGIPTDKPTLDKHSTGGVGDKTSLIVVPILAAAGAFVCKMSGRGLGHTGGTLDKLEAIPGFRIGLSAEEMIAEVRNIGACLAGQTDTLAPADKKLYALRDATATVGSLPLIVSSILSKKLAGGAKSFLFDVKVGDGALLATFEEAKELAQSLVDGAYANNRQAVAVLSNMDAPLGRAVGNAVEIAEAIAILSDAEGTDARLREICITLAGEALQLCGISSTAEDGRARAAELLTSGAAKEKLRAIIIAQGGDGNVVDFPADVLPQAPVQLAVVAPRSGYIARIGAKRVGEIVVVLGGGRARKEDTIDPAVGVILAKNVGDPIAAGEMWATVYAANQEAAAQAAADLQTVIEISDDQQAVVPLVHAVIHGT